MSAKILGPDGVLVDAVVFSTTSTSRFITGTVTPDTSDVLVSIRGGAYTSDPTMVSFTGTSFVVPNPSAYPNGLDLFSGENVIGIQAIPLVGTPSPAALATIILLQGDSDVLPFPPPTPVTIERLDQSVRVTATGVSDTRVTGYNFYASTESGGGTQGYTRVNVYPIFTPTVVETSKDLFTLESKNPSQVANPLYVKATVTQENSSEVVLATDVESRVEIPSSVTEIGTTVTLSSITRVSTYPFLHNRLYNEVSDPPTIFVGQFAALPTDSPLYYVATAIYYDSVTGVEYESYFSTEVVGSPINVRVQTVTLPAVSRQQILEDAIYSIYRQDPQVGVQPGAVIRDTFFDPFTTEAERLRFILDFLYRASSFDTLLQIDDPNGTGTSIPPSESSYKVALASAFFLANPDDVQPIIDGAFDKLAANFGVPRPGGKRSIGEARFYTPVTPTRTLTVALGTVISGGGIQYRTTRAGELPVDRLASFYNPTTRQYSITVPIQAVLPGSQGDIGPRQINAGAPYGFSVINDAGTFGGLNAYTNTQLASLARGALSSVDTGTTQGYYQTASGVPGVIQAMVVRAGSPLMQRDFDPTTGRHLGGKVDVWAQGLRPALVSDVFAFTYVRKRDIQFVLVGNPGLYQFQALDPDLSLNNPLSQMLDYPSLGLGLRNATTGEVFDLTGVQILNYNTIQLSQDPGIVQPPVTLTDVVLGDYRYRTGEKYVFSRQPVNYVSSVVGEVVGTLDIQSFYLVHPDSPLGLGRSTQAGDYVQIVQSPDPSVVSPSGSLIQVTDELHVLTGYYTENVFALGADSLTVVVKDFTGTVTYVGPWDPSGTPDYDIIEGTQTTPLGIRRTSSSTIPDGGSVKISYEHDENFSVTYQTNLVTSALQDAVEAVQHTTADVVAKGALQVPVDLTATIVLKKGYLQSSVDQELRSNLQYLVSNLRMGTPLRRSDVISTIDSTNGVSYVVVPLTTMGRAVGSQVAREDLATGTLSDTYLVRGWSTQGVSVWLLKQELECPTVTGGGPLGSFSGVFADDYPLTTQDSSPSGLASGPDRFYIIGSSGLDIPGYSDTATLNSQGYVTPSDVSARRKEITQNRVLISQSVGSPPSDKSYWVTYNVGSVSGDRDITPSEVEYLVLGNVTATYTEDRA